MRATAHRRSQCLIRCLLAVVSVPLLGCSDSTGPTTGSVLAYVITLGEPRDLDESFTVQIDNGPEQILTTINPVKFAALQPGTHLVQLNGVASNCALAGVNPRPIDAPASKESAPTMVLFIVQCTALVATVHLTTETTGTDLDADGYNINLEGYGATGIGANGTADFVGIPQGAIVVSLTEVAGNCTVTGTNPRTVNVPGNGVVNVAFAIVCVTSGSFRVTTSTTGTFVDPNGFALATRSLNTGGSLSVTHVPANGVITISGELGDYRLTLLDIMPNCDLTTPNPQTATATAGAPTAVNLEIKCDNPTDLAFSSVWPGPDEDINIMSSNNGNLHRLTTSPLDDIDPAWSPDGTRIAFTSKRDGNSDIYVMAADGTSQVRLTNSPFDDFHPAWSPDGTKIAFVSTRDANNEIYVMNVDGSNPVRITDNPANDGDPAWSPDGTKIAFSSARESGGGIWIMKADGTNPTRVTTNVRPDAQPAWSPDGKKIAFSRPSGDGSDIFLVLPDGSGLTQLTDDMTYASDPDWSPDGSKIAFGSAPGSCGYYDYYCDPYIAIVNINGVHYTNLETLASNPAWRP
jgi:Tol biopolymer transport system component